MCLFSVYRGADSDSELVLERVCKLEDLGDKIRCVDLFGRSDIVPGRIHLVDTNRARIEIVMPEGGKKGA